MLTQTARSVHTHRARLSPRRIVFGLLALAALIALAKVTGLGFRYVGVEALLGPSVLVPIVPVHATRLRSAGASGRSSVRPTRPRPPRRPGRSGRSGPHG